MPEEEGMVRRRGACQRCRRLYFWVTARGDLCTPMKHNPRSSRERGGVRRERHEGSTVTNGFLLLGWVLCFYHQQKGGEGRNQGKSMIGRCGRTASMRKSQEGKKRKKFRSMTYWPTAFRPSEYGAGNNADTEDFGEMLQREVHWKLKKKKKKREGERKR